MSDDQHTSPIKSPRQLIIVVLLAFIVPIVVIYLLAHFVASGGTRSTDPATMKPEAVAERLAEVGAVSSVKTQAVQALRSGKEVYTLACGACHAAGIAGAPKVGDAGAWSPRIAKGFDTLVGHAIKGFNAMPPKGGSSSLHDIEVARATAYMANESGADFAEPAQPGSGS